MAEDMVQFTLRIQLRELSKQYFPTMKKLPSLLVVPEADNNGHGPAWLNALAETVYIDERVSTFLEKTTRILILHELIHWSNFQENGDPDEGETERFQAELTRIKKLGAYTGLL